MCRIYASVAVGLLATGALVGTAEASSSSRDLTFKFPSSLSRFNKDGAPSSVSPVPSQYLALAPCRNRH